jgi:hypothetical protein
MITVAGTGTFTSLAHASAGEAADAPPASTARANMEANNVAEVFTGSLPILLFLLMHLPPRVLRLAVDILG